MSTLIVVGRLGGDAELRETQSNTKVLGFSVADEIGWGEKKRTQWIKCALFGERAAKLQQYMTKGTMVEVIGTPAAEAWLKDGEAKCAIKLTVSEVKLHGGGERKSDPAPKRGRVETYEGGIRNPVRHDEDSEIPF